MTLEIADPPFPPQEKRNWLPHSPLPHTLTNDCAQLSRYRCRLVSCAFWHHTPPWAPKARELIDEGIYLSLSGGMKIRTSDGTIHRILPNHVALVPRWLRHQHGYIHRSQNSQQMLAIHCQWTDHAGRSLFARLPQISFLLPSLERRQRLVSLAYHFARSPESAMTIAPGMLQTLLHDLLLSGTKLSPETHEDLAITEALTRCQQDDWSQLTVTDLANAARLKPSRFRQRFRQATGLSPVQYLQGMRLEHAARLLQNSDEDLSRIAAQVGFSSITHFHGVFKKLFGCTPLTWRLER